MANIEMLNNYSNFEEEYGWEILNLKNVIPIDYSKLSENNYDTFRIDTNKIESPFYPFSYALKFLKNKPVKIERCRLLHSYELHKSFKEAIIEESDLYFEFLFKIFQLECLESDDGRNQYSVILKLLVRFNKQYHLKLVLELLLKTNRIWRINSEISNEFHYLHDGCNNPYVGRVINEAIYNNHFQTLKILLEYGAELDFQDSNGLYPWEIIFRKTITQIKWPIVFQMEIILLKNTLRLPSKNILMTRFDEFINNRISSTKNSSVKKQKSKADEEKDIASCGMFEYFKFLIKTNEYNSLKHYSRNILRLSRIQWNKNIYNENIKCIQLDEKNYYF